MSTKKKVLVSIISVLGAVVLFFVVCVLILFLAPGTEVFGIRYVSAIYKNEGTKQDIDVFNEFTGDLYLETYGVPITITYSDYYNSNVYFVQEFVGLTKSKYNQATLSMEVDDKGNLHIKANEVVPWLYSRAFQEYKLELTLPSFFKAAENPRSFYINSKKSDLTIKGESKYNDFSFKSEGELKLEDQILGANNFIYHTSKAIVLEEKVACINADLNSSASSITIKNELSGNLKAQTKTGDIKFKSCKDLNLKTKSGSVRFFGEGLITIYGETIIESKSGDVELGIIGVDALNEAEQGHVVDQAVKIKTTSGNISINKMLDGEIVTDRGNISVNYVRSIIATSYVGNISIKTSYKNSFVTSRNGNINLGSAGLANNPTASTTTGKIKVVNAQGNVNIKSKTNNVEFEAIKNDVISEEAKQATINISAGRDLIAKNLVGEVSATANGNVEIVFLNGTLNLETGSKSKQIKIDAKTLSYYGVNVDLKSTKGAKAKIYAGETLIVEKAEVVNTIENINQQIKVRTSYGKIVLLLEENVSANDN